MGSFLNWNNGFTIIDIVPLNRSPVMPYMDMNNGLTNSFTNTIVPRCNSNF